MHRIHSLWLQLMNGIMPYTRQQAAFPLYYVTQNKFWPSVARVNNTYGDRNLICTCEPIECYMEAEA